MKVAWVALALGAGTAVLASFGCGDDTGSGGAGAATGSSSSSGMESSGSGMGGTSSTGGTSSSSGNMGSSSGSGAGGPYKFCGDCTDLVTGAYTKECKTQNDKCAAVQACADLRDWAYANATTDKAGACALFAHIKTNNIPAAVVTDFKALDNCVTCTTCKSLCEPASTEWCTNIADNGATCP